MSGEKNLQEILKTLRPQLNKGDYVFCVTTGTKKVNPKDIILSFKEKEGTTLILKKEKADKYNLKYSFVASWITLTVYSSLEAVGLTAAFSGELAKKGISCNVVAAYYHDHIFVAKGNAKRAIKILCGLSK